ncbi:VOC family protein [Marinicella meishanensis]|uniref:VOC family protein n=1 Tax=Marinicella meishanensis TaxID=2873263 RepID=UPI001CC0B2FE|nr:VOC family protein [Marinicella sp. NBU2979]
MNLNQITILSPDVNRAMAFYQMLGLQLIVDASPRYVRLACPSGDSTFSISHSEAAQAGCEAAGTVLYFEVADVDRTHRRLVDHGIPFLIQPQDQPWLWRESLLQDPDGHPIKIYSAGHHRKNPPWRVSQNHNQAKGPDKKWYHHISDSPYNLMK